ncbi:hotdog domain-containing protein [Haladaptatus pallidirubidus]|nr:acyl-[acyl-carrier-protein] thioesterase [Haladaptatus pallidirubidus]
MQTIVDHPVQFGELAGSLVHGAMFFDWQLISTQKIAAAFDYSFEQILAADGIPYAPVVVDTSVDRYPTIGETVTVETTPQSVGDSSIELLYEMVDGDGERLATAQMIHVTISPAGTALALPEKTRSDFIEACADRSATVGVHTKTPSGEQLPSFSSSFEIRSPHIEGAELAYFEEYPRFADISLEEFLGEQGTSQNELQGEKQPYHLRNWSWEFLSPVYFESTLSVSSDVLEVDQETICIAHEFTSGGQTNIKGITEYGCYDRSGHPVLFDAPMLAPFEE